MRGIFITFEGTEGGGKSTQISRLAGRLRALGREVVELREPGGTPLGEEIRHLLKHSGAGQGMSAEAELLLVCASRAQLVRQVIRPALAAGKVVLCDRFHDSTIAYQGNGRGLDAAQVRAAIELAVGDTLPDLTVLLAVPVAVSEARRALRSQAGSEPSDRFEEADRAFFERVERGYAAIASAEPERVAVIDATGPIDAVAEQVWRLISSRLE